MMLVTVGANGIDTYPKCRCYRLFVPLKSQFMEKSCPWNTPTGALGLSDESMGSHS